MPETKHTTCDFLYKKSILKINKRHKNKSKMHILHNIMISAYYTTHMFLFITTHTHITQHLYVQV